MTQFTIGQTVTSSTGEYKGLDRGTITDIENGRVQVAWIIYTSNGTKTRRSWRKSTSLALA